MLLDISIIPQTSEELFYFVTKRIPYLCGFWRFANAYDTIKIKGTKFHVAGIGKAAFKGCKLATRAVIGKYVSVIENSVFESCGKLKKINLKTTTLKKIGKKAFKGIHKKARFTVPKKQLKKYKKIFKSAKVIKKSMKISG